MGMDKRQRAQQRRELVERAAELYRQHEHSWTPTADVATALGIDEGEAASLISRARLQGLLNRAPFDGP